MKYGIYFAYWENQWATELLPYVAKVKKLGFDVLELSCASLKTMEKADILALRNEAAANGVTVTAGYGPNASENLGSADPDTVKNAISFYTDTLKKLELLDVHTIGGGIYSYWPVDYSRPIDKAGDRARSIENVRKVGRIARECGVDYCLEVLNRFEGYILNTCAEAVDFVTEVDEPAVKVMLDTFHMNIEEDSITDAIRLAGDKLGHFHVGENNRRLPGRGNMPWSDIGKALRSIGYDKAVVMEPFVLPGGEVGRDIKVWRTLEADTSPEKLDADAQESVRYLRFAFGE
ncbi:MAG: sugar phosphate isomerase/epimerase [Ruminococcaceae bacterium]|nr:sugar phosphate isomerase/epimerase [Oscillospiraceae bacterium]